MFRSLAPRSQVAKSGKRALIKSPIRVVKSPDNMNRSQVAKSGKSLVRVLKNNRETQYLVLANIGISMYINIGISI